MKEKGVASILIAILVVGLIGAGIGAYVISQGEQQGGQQPEGPTEEQAPAEFEVSNLSLSSSQVKPGETVTISVDVSNVGEQPGDNTVELKIDGTVENTRTVTLGGGETTTISFTIQKETTKSYSVEVGDLSQSFEVVEPASFEVSDLTISPSEVEPGQTVTISVDVKNVGGESGTQTIELKINGTTQQTKSVTLGSGESTSISFTVTKNIEGSYSVGISGLSGSFNVVKAAPETITIQGTGDTVTSSFVLEQGISIFHMAHDGYSNFAIVLYDAETGEYIDLLVNVIGSFSGRTLVGVTTEGFEASPGKHLLEITADGNWEVTIEQPRPTTAPKAPQTFTGSGQDVSSPFTLESGTATFEMTHDGTSNFAITLYNKNGEYEDLLVNEIGAYSGSNLVSVQTGGFEATPGIHYLDITADGNWEIVVTQ